MRPTIQRALSTWERLGPWAAVTLVASLGMAVCVAMALGGALGAPDFWGDTLRGYTGTGILTGIVASFLCLSTLLYTLRKRTFQERFPVGRGTMAAWLWIHIAIGVLCAVAVILHAGLGTISLHWSSGKALLLVLGTIVVSGVIWRVVYFVVPQAAAQKVGHYAESESASRAEELRTEIDKIAAGKSEALRTRRDWILAKAPRPEEVRAALHELPAEEQQDLLKMAELEEERQQALRRLAEQKRFRDVLQGLRIVHVPLTLAIPVALVVHVILALQAPERLLPVGGSPLGSLAGFAPAEDCRSCHQALYDQWSSSMHAHALKSPVMIAQNNQLFRAVLSKTTSPDPALVCVNCHGPVGVLLSGDGELPLSRLGYDQDFLNEGIGCTTCHQYNGGSSPGAGGLSAFQASFEPGTTYVGAFDDAVSNAYHRSRGTALFREPDSLCINCHVVQYDTTGDGRVVKGEDLVLQTTHDEYEEYRRKGGEGTCVGCHMPLLSGTRAADSALPLLEQDSFAPDRRVRSHAFVGVDHPLDISPEKDESREARQALLRGSAALELDAPRTTGQVLRFRVKIANVGAGHSLPTGFAFARQMWLEVTVRDKAGQLVGSSGLVARVSDDLCDGSTLAEAGNPSRPYFTGCEQGVDTSLVSFQQKLVDHFVVDRSAKRNDRGDPVLAPAAGAQETWIQYLTSGVVPRTRADGKKFPVLGPFETRTVDYALPLKGAHGPLTLGVRLLFRSLPPYMIRALGAGQPLLELPRLAPLVENLEIVEMQTTSQLVTAP